ncbi:MAG: lamin tail domain-containing protein [Sandaracinaceae bacterium]|nr:lamin tail domain-containing protein [Sandaracinaceae bacterium]MDW8246287.1 lamin tail domain-containing protein [Sandaracinaceae bacterium]
MPLLLSHACGSSSQSAVRLVIVSSLRVPEEVDGLALAASLGSGASVPETVFSLQGKSFPQTWVVRALPENPSDTIRFSVRALKGSTIVLQRVVEGRFVPQTIVDLVVELDRSCYGIECPPWVDCQRGACILGPSDAGLIDAPINDAFREDLGVDAGQDAPSFEMPDAHSLDAHVIDVFSPLDSAVDEARSPDAGTDAPRSDTFFATDSGTDALGNPDSGIGCRGAACRGAIVISEFATSGSRGALDEFIEIHNRSNATADIGGLRFVYTSASGSSRSTRGTVLPGTLLPSGGFLLLTGSGYAGSPSSDLPSFSSGASDSGGSWSIENEGMVLDRVCWGSAVASICEGNPLPAFPSNMASSYERKARPDSTPSSMSPGGRDERAGNGHDTDQNDMDFVLRPTREPQSSMSPPEPPG